jgi:hypothetical protein
MHSSQEFGVWVRSGNNDMKYIKLFTGTRRLGSMGSTTTNGKNHVLPIDSGTPTEPKRRISVNYALRINHITLIRPFYKQLEIKTNRTSFLFAMWLSVVCKFISIIRNSYNALFQSIRTDDDLIREILDPKDRLSIVYCPFGFLYGLFIFLINSK